MAEEEALRAEIVRLNKMVTALMNRAEREVSARGTNFGLFQTTVMLENQVRSRTGELEAALRDNERINRDLQREVAGHESANRALAKEREEQRALIKKLEDAHNQLLQSEKLASIGELAAGVAHEINNPIGFVNSNLGTLKRYVDDLLALIDEYAALEPELAAQPELQARIEAAKRRSDIEFLREDIGSLIAESIDGTTRVRRIVQDLRDFSRAGESRWESIDLHAGLESTINVAWNEIKYKAEVVRDYGELPPVECLPSQINQVFLNLLVNAAQAIPQKGHITLTTRREGAWAVISVADTGCGIPPEIRDKIFDPFFTTKPVGKGTGLGLSVSYGIVEKHGGHIEVESEPGKGSTFIVRLPMTRAANGATAPATAPATAGAA